MKMALPPMATGADASRLHRGRGQAAGGHHEDASEPEEGGHQDLVARP